MCAFTRRSLNATLQDRDPTNAFKPRSYVFILAQHPIATAQLSLIRQACSPAHVIALRSDLAGTTEASSAAPRFDLRALLVARPHLEADSSLWIAPMDRLIHFGLQPHALRDILANHSETDLFQFSDEVTHRVWTYDRTAPVSCERIIWARNGRKLVELVAELATAAPLVPLHADDLKSSDASLRIWPQCLQADVVYAMASIRGLQTFSETQCKQAVTIPVGNTTATGYGQRVQPEYFWAQSPRIAKSETRWLGTETAELAVAVHIFGFANDVEAQLDSVVANMPQADIRLDFFFLLFYDEFAEGHIVDRLRQRSDVSVIYAEPLNEDSIQTLYRGAGVEALYRHGYHEDVFWFACHQKLSFLSKNYAGSHELNYDSEVWLRSGWLLDRQAFQAMKSYLLGNTASAGAETVWVHDRNNMLEFVLGSREAVRTFFGDRGSGTEQEAADNRAKLVQECLQLQSSRRTMEVGGGFNVSTRNSSKEWSYEEWARELAHEAARPATLCTDPNQYRILDLDSCYARFARSKGIRVQQHLISLQSLSPLAGAGSNSLVYMNPSHIGGSYAVCIAGLLRSFRFAFADFHARITAQTDGEVHYFFHVYYSPSSADDLAALHELQLHDAVKVLVAEPWSDRVERQILQDLPDLGDRNFYSQLQYAAQARKVFLANQLRREYQTRFGIQYAGVVRSRPDLGLRIDVPIQDFLFPNTLSFGRCHDVRVCRVFDMFAIAPPAVMDVYASLYWHMPYCAALGLKSRSQCMPTNFDCMILLMEERSMELNEVSEWHEYRPWAFQHEHAIPSYPFKLIRSVNLWEYGGAPHFEPSRFKSVIRPILSFHVRD